MIPFLNNTLKALLRLFTYEVKFIKSFKNRITKGRIPGVGGGQIWLKNRRKVGKSENFAKMLIKLIAV